MKLAVTNKRKSGRHEGGFTLVEIITVIVIIGTLSIFAAVEFNQSHIRIQYQTTIQKIATDVRLAQQLALSEGRGTRVIIDQSNNRYYLTWDDGTYVQKLIGGGNFVVQLGTGDFFGVTITDSKLDDGRLNFTTAGQPLAGDEEEVIDGELDMITLNNARKLTITANTGFLKIEDL